MRDRLFAGESGGLRPVGRKEKEFPTFASQGIDLFESANGSDPIERTLRPVFKSCMNCHSESGIHSLRIRSIRHDIVPAWDTGYETAGAGEWKTRQYSWGLLQGLWETGAVGSTH